MSSLRKISRLLLLAVALVLLMPGQAHAYIGPGAGFALAGSFFAVFAAVFSALADVHHLAGAAAQADALRLAGAAAQPVQAGGHPRPRRHGPRPDRDDARGGQAAAPGRPARAGLLQAAGHHRAAALAGGVVDVPDGSTPASTTSSTSSRRTCAPTARSSARSRSARRAGRSAWASTGFPWARPTCGCCARASRSGAS